VLELASGSGEHVVHFAGALPALVFQPSDPDPQARAAIAARTARTGLANVRPPLAIDAAAPDWPLPAEFPDALVAIVCINMVHIVPWRATRGMLDGAARLLPHGGLLYLYGPYRREGRHTSPSNEAFDRALRERDAEWGVRDVQDIEREARPKGLVLQEILAMPANNMSLVLRRA
jgi:hypothetical protein